MHTYDEKKTRKIEIYGFVFMNKFWKSQITVYWCFVHWMGGLTLDSGLEGISESYTERVLSLHFYILGTFPGKSGKTNTRYVYKFQHNFANYL